PPSGALPKSTAVVRLSMMGKVPWATLIPATPGPVVTVNVRLTNSTPPISTATRQVPGKFVRLPDPSVQRCVGSRLMELAVKLKVVLSVPFGRYHFTRYESPALNSDGLNQNTTFFGVAVENTDSSAGRS